MFDALDLPIDVALTNSFSPIPNNIMLENIQRVVRQMHALMMPRSRCASN